MAQSFKIGADVVLGGPYNLRPVVQAIRSGVGGVNVDVTPRLAPGAAKGVSGLASGVASLKSALSAADDSAKAVSRSLKGVSLDPAAADSVAKLGAGLARTQAGLGRLRDQLGDSASQSELLGRSLGVTARRFGAFFVITRAFDSVRAAFGEGVRQAVDFQHEMTRLGQIGGTTARDISEIQQEVSRLATGLGASSADLAKFSTTLRQAGLSAGDTKTALEALAETTLAPTFESIHNTTEGLIALRQQFGVTARDFKSYFGSINTVSAAYAVESGDLVTAIRKTGGAFRAASGDMTGARDSFNQLLALFTSVRSTTRESADEISTGLRTIFGRLQSNQVSDSLKQMGINLRHTAGDVDGFGRSVEGQFVGAYEAVRRLSAATKNLSTSDPRFSEIAQQIGGYRQISRVIPLLQQVGVAQRAYSLAQTGSNSLTQDAAKSQDAFAVKLSKVREEFFDLIRTVGDNKSFKNFLDTMITGATLAVRLAKSLEPLVPLLTAISIRGIATSSAGLFRGFKDTVTNIPAAVANTARRPAFARGGVVQGQGVGDTVPATLPVGSYVIKRSSAKKIGHGTLSRMARGYASGGQVDVMLTPQEFVFDDREAERIGKPKLDQMNRTGHVPGSVDPRERLAMKLKALADGRGVGVADVMKPAYASGGRVDPHRIRVMSPRLSSEKDYLDAVDGFVNEDRLVKERRESLKWYRSAGLDEMWADAGEDSLRRETFRARQEAADRVGTHGRRLVEDRFVRRRTGEQHESPSDENMIGVQKARDSFRGLLTKRLRPDQIPGQFDTRPGEMTPEDFYFAKGGPVRGYASGGRVADAATDKASAHAAFRDLSRRTRESADTREKYAVQDYTGPGYSEINRAQESGSDHDLASDLRGLTRKNKVGSRLAVYRGTEGSPRRLFGFNPDDPKSVGKTYRPKGFLSTSVDPDVARGYGSVQSRIVLPRNFRASGLGGLTASGENEVLLGDKARLRYLGHKDGYHNFVARGYASGGLITDRSQVAALAASLGITPDASNSVRVSNIDDRAKPMVRRHGLDRVLNAAGVPSRTDAVIKGHHGGEGLSVYFEGKRAEGQREVYQNKQGSLDLAKNVEFLAGKQGRGAGTESYARQILHGGLSKIKLEAAGDFDDPEGMSGYYVWPSKFGADGPLPLRARSAMIEAGVLPPHLASSHPKVSDVLALPGGDEIWKRYGSNFNAEIDPSSPHVLGKLHERLAKRKGYASGGIVRDHDSGRYYNLDLKNSQSVGQKVRQRRVEADPVTGKLTPRARWYAAWRTKRGLYNERPRFEDGGVVPAEYLKGLESIGLGGLNVGSLVRRFRRFDDPSQYGMSKGAQGGFDPKSGDLFLHSKPQAPERTVGHEVTHAVDRAFALQGGLDKTYASQTEGHPLRRLAGLAHAAVTTGLGETERFKGYHERGPHDDYAHEHLAAGIGALIQKKAGHTPPPGTSNTGGYESPEFKAFEEAYQKEYVPLAVSNFGTHDAKRSLNSSVITSQAAVGDAPEVKKAEKTSLAAYAAAVRDNLPRNNKKNREAFPLAVAARSLKPTELLAGAGVKRHYNAAAEPGDVEALQKYSADLGFPVDLSNVFSLATGKAGESQHGLDVSRLAAENEGGLSGFARTLFENSHSKTAVANRQKEIKGTSTRPGLLNQLDLSRGDRAKILKAIKIHAAARNAEISATSKDREDFDAYQAAAARGLGVKKVHYGSNRKVIGIETHNPSESPLEQAAEREPVRRAPSLATDADRQIRREPTVSQAVARNLNDIPDAGPDVLAADTKAARVSSGLGGRGRLKGKQAAPVAEPAAVAKPASGFREVGGRHGNLGSADDPIEVSGGPTQPPAPLAPPVKPDASARPGRDRRAGVGSFDRPIDVSGGPTSEPTRPAALLALPAPVAKAAPPNDLGRQPGPSDAKPREKAGESPVTPPPSGGGGRGRGRPRKTASGGAEGEPKPEGRKAEASKGPDDTAKLLRQILDVLKKGGSQPENRTGPGSGRRRKPRTGTEIAVRQHATYEVGPEAEPQRTGYEEYDQSSTRTALNDVGGGSSTRKRRTRKGAPVSPSAARPVPAGAVALEEPTTRVGRRLVNTGSPFTPPNQDPGVYAGVEAPFHALHGNTYVPGQYVHKTRVNHNFGDETPFGPEHVAGRVVNVDVKHTPKGRRYTQAPVDLPGDVTPFDRDDTHLAENQKRRTGAFLTQVHHFDGHAADHETARRTRGDGHLDGVLTPGTSSTIDLADGPSEREKDRLNKEFSRKERANRVRRNPLDVARGRRVVGGDEFAGYGHDLRGNILAQAEEKYGLSKAEQATLGGSNSINPEFAPSDKRLADLRKRAETLNAVRENRARLTLDRRGNLLDARAKGDPGRFSNLLGTLTKERSLPASPIGPLGGRAADVLRGSYDRLEQSGVGRTLGRFGNKATSLPVAVAASYAPHLLQQTFGTVDAPRGSRDTAAKAAAAGGALQFGAVGAQVGLAFGPMGAAIGAAAGALYGWTSTLKESKNRIEEIKFEESIKKFDGVIEAVAGGLIDLRSNLARVKQGVSLKTDEAGRQVRASGQVGNFFDRNLSGYFGETSGGDRLVRQTFGANPLDRYRQEADLTRKKSAELLSPELPGLQQIAERIASETRVAPGQTGLAGRAARQTAFDANGGGDILRTISRITDLPIEDLRSQYDRVITAANKVRLADDANAKAANLAAIQFTKFSRLGQAVEAASTSVLGLRAASEAIASRSEGNASGVRVTGFAEAASQVGGIDREAFSNSVKFVQSGLGAGGGLSKGFGDTISEIDEIRRGLAGEITRAIRGGGYNEETISGDVEGAFKGYSPESRKRLTASAEGISTNDLLRRSTENPEALAEELVQKAFGDLPKVHETLARSLQEHLNTSGSGYDRGFSLQNSLGDTLDRQSAQGLASVRASAALKAARTGRHQELSVDELDAPFSDTQRRLAGPKAVDAFDPKDLVARFTKASSEFEAQSRIVNSPTAKPEERDRAQRQSSALGSEMANLQGALRHLADTTSRVASLQEKLAEVERERSGQLGFSERLATADPSQLHGIRRAAALSDVAVTQGHFNNFNAAGRSAVLEHLNSLQDVKLPGYGNRTGGEVREGLLNQVRGAVFGRQAAATDARRLDLLGRQKGVEDEGGKALAGLAEVQKKVNTDFIASLDSVNAHFLSGLQRVLAQADLKDAASEVDRAELGLRKARSESSAASSLTQFGGPDPLARARTVLGSPELPALKGGLAENDRVSAAFRDRASLSIASSFSKAKGGLADVYGHSVPSRFEADSDPNKFRESLRKVSQALDHASDEIGARTGIGGDQVRREVIPRVQASFEGANAEKRTFQTGPALKDALEEVMTRRLSASREQVTAAKESVAQSGFGVRKPDDQTGNFIDQVARNSDFYHNQVKGVGTAQTLDDVDVRLKAAKEALAKAYEEQAKRQGQGVEFKASGGSVFRPRGTDTVPAMLSPGEFVVNPKSAAANRGLLERMNSGKGAVYRADGGFADNPYGLSEDSPGNELGLSAYGLQRQGLEGRARVGSALGSAEAASASLKETVARPYRETPEFKPAAPAPRETPPAAAPTKGPDSSRLLAEAAAARGSTKLDDASASLRAEISAAGGSQTLSPPPAPAAATPPVGVASRKPAAYRGALNAGKSVRQLIDEQTARDVKRRATGRAALKAGVARYTEGQELRARNNLGDRRYDEIVTENTRRRQEREVAPQASAPQGPAKPSLRLLRAASRNHQAAQRRTQRLGYLKASRANKLARAQAKTRNALNPHVTDVVPAMLTPGEFVVKAKAAEHNMGFLNRLNRDTEYRANGGVVGRTQADGTPDGSSGRQGPGGGSPSRAFDSVVKAFQSAAAEFKAPAAQISEAGRQFAKAAEGLSGAAKLGDSLKPFVDAALQLSKAMASVSIPSAIKLETKSQVEVLINGAQVLAAIKGDLASELTREVLARMEAELPRMISNMPAR